MTVKASAVFSISTKSILSYFKYLKKADMNRETAQQLRALAALWGDPGSSPSTHMVAPNCLSLLFPVIPHTDIHSGKEGVDALPSMLKPSWVDPQHCKIGGMNVSRVFLGFLFRNLTPWLVREGRS